MISSTAVLLEQNIERRGSIMGMCLHDKATCHGAIMKQRLLYSQNLQASSLCLWITHRPASLRLFVSTSAVIAQDIQDPFPALMFTHWSESNMKKVIMEDWLEIYLSPQIQFYSRIDQLLHL
ncbi:Hypothetical predicted protein [Pelobates cultripes]|uniref:Uncharacterized protein n=1 Tax=Pelobates cultripes TaxID=61616 RepID=A0AAD1SLZ5_PELCU|nr:Hypothetical predicted protein [Pelobates cultripes]